MRLGLICIREFDLEARFPPPYESRGTLTSRIERSLDSAAIRSSMSVSSVAHVLHGVHCIRVGPSCQRLRAREALHISWLPTKVAGNCSPVQFELAQKPRVGVYWPADAHVSAW